MKSKIEILDMCVCLSLTFYLFFEFLFFSMDCRFYFANSTVFVFYPVTLILILSSVYVNCFIYLCICLLYLLFISCYIYLCIFVCLFVTILIDFQLCFNIEVWCMSVLINFYNVLLSKYLLQ